MGGDGVKDLGQSMGGVINIITVKPTKYFEGSTSASYGTDADWQLRGVAAGRTSEDKTGVYARVSAWSHTNRGYTEVPYQQQTMMAAGTSFATPTRSFLPSSRMFMTILGRTFGRGFSYPQAQFSDFQTAPAWAQDHISLLSSLGIVSGYGGPTGEVRPLNTITRAEFASLLFKMY